MLRPERAPQPDVTVRLATPADSAEVSRILFEAFSVIREHYTGDAFGAVTPNADEIEGRFAEGPIWVAEIDGEVVGTVSRTTEPEGLYVRSMAVSPKAQGRGVGRKLLNALHEEAAGRGIGRIFLYTLPQPHTVRAMYEKHGYKWVRDTPADEWFGVPGLEMEKFFD